MNTWYCIRGQFTRCQHNIPEVERGVVNTAQFLVHAVFWVEIFQGRFDPSETRQVTPGQHIHVSMLCAYGLDTFKRKQLFLQYK